jgi:sugar/nucleoside kinase (ribokinase family)
VRVVDVTGASDTFGGALVFGLAHGLELETALELSIAAASRAVTIVGPQGGIASLATLREFAAEHGRWLPATFERSPDR